jgi:hypothetical protein
MCKQWLFAPHRNLGTLEFAYNDDTAAGSTGSAALRVSLEDHRPQDHLLLQM